MYPKLKIVFILPVLFGSTEGRGEILMKGREREGRYFN
jgi:hypothetical protein